MLKINAEPGYFTEVFTELKACGQLLNRSYETSYAGAWHDKLSLEILGYYK